MWETGRLHHPLNYFVEYFAFPSWLQQWLFRLATACSHIPQMQPLVKETGGIKLRNWATLLLPGIRLLRVEQCEPGDLWVMRKEDDGFFVRCEGVVSCPCGGDTNLLRDRTCFLTEVVWMQLGAGIHFTCWCLKRVLLKASAPIVSEAESCFVLFPGGLWHPAFSGDSVCWFAVGFAFFFPP